MLAAFPTSPGFRLQLRFRGLCSACDTLVAGICIGFVRPPLSHSLSVPVEPCSQLCCIIIVSAHYSNTAPRILGAPCIHIGGEPCSQLCCIIIVSACCARMLRLEFSCPEHRLIQHLKEALLYPNGVLESFPDSVVFRYVYGRHTGGILMSSNAVATARPHLPVFSAVPGCMSSLVLRFPVLGTTFVPEHHRGGKDSESNCR